MTTADPSGDRATESGTEPDAALLRQFVETRAQDAFTRLVARHIDLVYSAALRQLGDRHLAEDVTQAAFLALAQKASSLRRETVLASWLVVVTRYAAIDARKSDARRRRHEQTAASMNQTVTPPEPPDDLKAWQAIAPDLDEALASLASKDRRVVVLRYLEGRDLDEVAALTGTTREAAKQRLHRAVQRMRDFFRSRGVHVPVASLGPSLLAFGVQPAPPALVASVATGALAGAAASASGVSIAKGALAAMAWTKTKMIAAVAGGVILAAGGTTAVVINAKPSAKTLTIAPAAPIDWKVQFQRTYGLADGQVAKLVAPPFGPERAQYMRENRLSGEWPDQRLTFEWDGEPHWQSSSMGPTLETLMHLGVKLKRFQYDDPGGLLNTPMIGDWVFRKRSTPEERLAGVAEALSQHLNRTVRFEKRRMRGEVVVASGTYSYSPFVPPPGSGDTGATSAPGGARVILATDVPAPDPAQGRTERGSLSQLFDKLEWAAGFAFEDKTESSGVDVAWQTHLRRPPDLDALLSSLRQQTGLTFQRQPREMDVWMIVGGDVADSSDRPWQSRFRQVYGLAPGQAVKLVGPPFIPERQAFWAEAQRQMTPQPPRPLAGQPDLSIGVEWQGDTPRWVYAGGNRTLWYGLQSAVGVNSWELDESIPRDLNMPGDWVTREGANVEEKLASLGPIVSTLLGRPVRFEKRTGPREAVVVRGTYSYSPLWTSGGDEMIEFFDATPPGHKTPPVVNTTPLSALWAALQYRLERRVFDETTSPSPAVRWRDYLYTADREALLRNLSKQTSLRFSREPRVMEYWTMVDEKR